MSDEAVTAKRLRRRLERQRRSTGSDTDRVKYRQACRQANRLINESRKTYFKRRIETAAGDWKQRWRIANELLYSRDTYETGTDTENSHLSKSFAGYFASKIRRFRKAAVAALRSTPRRDVGSPRAPVLCTLSDRLHVGHTIH